MIPRRRAYLHQGEFTDINQRLRTNDSNNTGVIHAWEKAIARYTGVSHAGVVNSGRRGMTLILKHLNLRPEDEIIIPAYTLKDLIPLIRSTGARVIPADIDPETFNITIDSIKQRITPQTRAIIALHAFGSPCAIEKIIGLADDHHGLKVIEDCAHSLGAAIRGRQTGSFGYAAFFSFETTKPINTFGGGMVVSKDEELIKYIHKVTSTDIRDLNNLQKKLRSTRTERLLFTTGLAYPLLYLLATPRWKDYVERLYRGFQHAPPEDIGYSPVQAEIGLKKIQTLEKRIKSRKEKAELLKSLLRPEIRSQRIKEGCESSWYFFVAILPCDASRIRKRMLLHGIDAGIGDEIADNCAAFLGYDDCPNVNRIFSRAIALPLYEGISEKEIHKIAGVLNKTVKI